MKIELANKIFLTPLNRKHATSLFTILTLNRSHFSPWLPFVREVYRLEQTKKFIRDEQILWKSKNGFSFAILESNCARGVISAKELNWIEKSTELGYWLDPLLQNQGIMTNAVNCLIKILTMEFGLQSFWIKCALTNLPSQGVAIKAGFELVGLEKKGDQDTKEVFLKFRLKNPKF